jgi:hypothetical protein
LTQADPRTTCRQELEAASPRAHGPRPQTG